ncbi:hypothetical protein QQS21_010613 [Conoideocrella luteorostrata]|uniref:Uncharacterized protein n=1 Tax=Conoideocrella luteorostrata TaxID=1105319 RepID=A0AAJ0FP72_9HYPO|nr:hypothetical protein QQS21_010613 [Conoideocrella luteorostrata]
MVVLRWNAQDTSRSTYVWLPLHISGATVSMQNYLNWLPSTGRKGPKDKTYSATSATLKDGATLVSCAKCNDGQAIDSIGGPSGGSATWSNIHSASSAVTTIRIYYINTKNAVLYANMTINDKTPRLLSFLPPEDKGPQISILNVAFQKGDSNTMKISGRDATYAPSIDYIAVPQS